MLRYSNQPLATNSYVSKYISHVFIHFFLKLLGLYQLLRMIVAADVDKLVSYSYWANKANTLFNIDIVLTLSIELTSIFRLRGR